MSEDLRSIRAGHNGSLKLFSFDFISCINIVRSSALIESETIGSSGHFVQSMEGAVSEDLQSRGASCDGSGKQLSFDFINSISIVLSHASIATALVDLSVCVGECFSVDVVTSGEMGKTKHFFSSGRFVRSIDGVVSDDLKSSDLGHDWSGDLFSFDFINSINIIGSSEMIGSNNVGSSGHFVQSMERVMSEDLQPSGANCDGSGKHLSFDFINPISIVLSHADIATASIDLSDCVRESFSCLSGQPGASRETNPSAGFMIGTNLFSFSERFDPLLDHGEDSTAVWISVAGSLFAILLIIAGVIFLFICRRLSFSCGTTLPESEIEGFTDSLFSFTAPDPFLSEQNALSVAVGIE
jgi:hypothetical protein